jgi:hypothetical protein
MVAFQAALVTVTSAPDWLTFPFHRWVTVWPWLNGQVSFQPLIASPGLPGLFTVTFAPNPPAHWLVTV